MTLTTLMILACAAHRPEPPASSEDDRALGDRLDWDDAAGALALSDTLGSIPLVEVASGAWTESRQRPPEVAVPEVAVPASEEVTYEFDDMDIEGELVEGGVAGGVVGGVLGGAMGAVMSGAVGSGEIAPDTLSAGGVGSRGSGLGGGGTAEGLAGGGGVMGYGSAAGDSTYFTRAPAAEVSRQLQGFRAGSTDDNVDFEAYLDFLDRWSPRADGGGYDWLEVSGRRFVQVVDQRGDPLPGARVSVVNRGADRLIWTATTYGDGRAPFYPESVPEAGWLVQAQLGDAWQTVRWDGQETIEVALDLEGEEGSGRVRSVALDVAFVIDTTGSMSDEIDRIKATLLRVTEKLRGASSGPDAAGELPRDFGLRYGAVLYRDITDDYVTRSYDFTPDIQAFDDALQQISASGGGDTPESLNQGLARAIEGLSWSGEGPKLLFLIADAEPHMDYQEDVPYTESVRAAVHDGIRVHTVAASGLSETGTLVFRQIAQYTRGQFVYIEYGGAAASAAAHGVTGQTASNNLDTILYQRIQAELDGWGLPRGAAVER